MKNYFLPLIAILCLTACSPKEQAKNDTPKTPVASTTMDTPKTLAPSQPTLVASATQPVNLNSTLIADYNKFKDALDKSTQLGFEQQAKIQEKTSQMKSKDDFHEMLKMNKDLVNQQNQILTSVKLSDAIIIDIQNKFDNSAKIYTKAIDDALKSQESPAIVKEKLQTEMQKALQQGIEARQQMMQIENQIKLNGSK